MPIYAYKCESCGFAKDVLQKMSDAPLQDCPQCGQSAFKKQVTAAGFQLKGSGWYVTDFKGGGTAPSTAVPPQTSADSKPAAADAAPVATAAKPAETAAAPSTPTTPSASST